MLSALKPFAGYLSVIATGDIETASDGTLLDANLAYNDEYHTCRSWPEWLEVAFRACRENSIERIWFHNGGGFDFVGLVLNLLKGEYKDQVRKFDVCMIGGVIIEVRLTPTTKQRVVKLADSNRLLPSSLENLARGFGFDGKDKIPDAYKSRMQDYRRDFPLQYHAYHKRDTLLLRDVLLAYREIVNEIAPIGNLRLTCASAAMRVFQTSFLDSEIATPGRRERDFTRLAYQGGRCEYIGDGRLDPGKRSTYSGVNTYDVHSMYPAIMHDALFPTCPGVFTRDASMMRYQNGTIRPGCYHASYEQRHGKLAVLKPRTKEGVAKNAAWEGKTHATYLELNEIEKHGGTVTLHSGVVYEDACMKPIFRTFVERLYSRRLKAAEQGNTALVLVLKLVMNNLYGKFGMGEEGERLAILQHDDVVKMLSQEDPPTLVNIPSLGDEAYSVSTPIFAAYMFPAIAAFITAGARLKLLSVANDHGIPVIYCDTDSIHTQAAFPPSLIHDTALGTFGCETSKHPEGITVTYGGRKIYAIHKTKKTKCKGIRPQAIEQASLIASIETRNPIKLTFHSPSKIKTAINRGHENPNEFREYFRTITADDCTAALGLVR